MKTTPVRNNFNGGEVSPKLDFRGDIDKYQSGCRTLEGFIPLIEGGVQRMPGTYYADETKDSSQKSRLIPFTFSTTQAYILEFGNEYIRVYKDHARIAGVEVVTPYQTADLPTLKVRQSADMLFIYHPSYATRRLIRTSHTAWTLDEAPFSPAPTQEKGHVLAATLTPAATTGTSITFTASAAVFLTADVGRMIEYGSARASITSFTSTSAVVCDILDAFPSTAAIPSGDWTLLYSPIFTLEPDRTRKGQICVLNPNGAKTNLIDPGADNWKESSVSGEYYLSVGAPFYYATEPDAMYVNNVLMTEGTLGSLSALSGYGWGWGDNDGLGYNTIYVRFGYGQDPEDSTYGYEPNFLQRLDSTNVGVFRPTDVGKFIFINNGCIRITKIDSSISARGEILSALSSTDATNVWTMEEEIWNATDGYPPCGGFFEQRLVGAGAPGYPQTVNLSTSADFYNFARNAEADDAAMEYTVASDGQVESVRWVAVGDYLFLGTTNGVLKMGASSSTDPFTQTNVSVKKQIGLGVKNIDRLAVSDSFMWVSLSGLDLYKMDFSLEKDKYIPTNMTRIASHIAKGATKALSGMTELAFQQSPFPIVWAVRADGQLLGMTYEVAENIYAWFRVITDGAFESVAVISDDGEEDQVWCIVKRTIDGTTVRYVEYFTPIELYGGIKDSFFVHAGATFDGGDPLTITGITKANPAVVSATNTFSGGEKVRIYDVEGMTEVNIGLTTAYTVANPTGSTFELSGITSADWGTYTGGGSALQVQKVFTSGLSHLEGKTVDVVIDGAADVQRTITSGQLTIGYYGNKVHIGLPVSNTLAPTMPYIQTAQGVSRGKKQRINELVVSVYETPCGKFGRDTTHLEAMKIGTGGTPALFSGEIIASFDGNWGTDAPVIITQDKPLPMTIRSINYSISVNEN
jgi:hypothetical protein